jgi:hypothetical protein
MLGFGNWNGSYACATPLVRPRFCRVAFNATRHSRQSRLTKASRFELDGPQIDEPELYVWRQSALAEMIIRDYMLLINLRCV